MHSSADGGDGSGRSALSVSLLVVSLCPELYLTAGSSNPPSKRNDYIESYCGNSDCMLSS